MLISTAETVAVQPRLSAAAENLEQCRVGTLILDRTGRIASCGEPAARIFADSQARLVGRSIGEFIDGLYLGGSSPSYGARYLDYLSGDGSWRRFEANDMKGEHFIVEIKLSPIATEGQELFLLSIRSPQQVSGPLPLRSGSLA